MKKVGIGVIGCGNISSAYLTAAKKFPILDIIALSDLNLAAAVARAAEFRLPARSVDAVLSDPSVEIVLNLTVPKAHVEVGLKAIAAGKHVHSEKPLGVALAEARGLIDAATARGLRVGCAPDTFLGGSQQTARQCIDDGLIGRPIAGTAFFMCPGHERWHPNPGFYYLAGGGPMLDMGPYYVTALVNLLGPVASVSGVTTRMRTERVITSQPLAGTRIPVEVATHVTGTLLFVSGAAVAMTMSFDVARHKHVPIELYGETGSLIVPDPNYFGGTIEYANAGEDWREIETRHGYADGNYRILGVADMAHAIRDGRPHRASGALALHVLEVMEAFQTSSDVGKAVAILTRPERPAPMPARSRPASSTDAKAAEHERKL
jgi:predicted dehydrogenase